jgi:acetyl esterase/lipase
MASLLSRIAVGVVRIRRYKRRYANLKAFHAYVAATRDQPHRPPPGLARRVRIEPDQLGSWPSYTIWPADRPATGRHLLYLHGGAYIFQMVKEQWDLVGALAQRLGCAVSVPGYPVPPHPGSGAAQIFPALLDAYRDLLTRIDAADLVVAGDSAGGGMALALAQLARREGVPQPKDLVLFAPWLDLALANSEIAPMARRDPMLAVPGLREAARMYAGDLPLDDPLLSPIHADLSGLGRISLFIGTRDIGLPDCRLLLRRAQKQRVPVDYFEYPGMFHDWMAAVLLPESRQVLRQVADSLARPDIQDLL